MNEPRAKPRKSAGSWRLAWRRFRRYKLGMAGLVIILFLFVVAFFSPLLANRQPMVCKYDGKIYFPAIMDSFHNIPFSKMVIRKARPFRFPSFNFKESFDSQRGDWAVWGLIPYGPIEIVTDPLQPPSADHWLGTDGVGRDVAARMVHGTGISMRVGFISMGIAVVIGLILGAIAGYTGGWIDIVISRVIEIVMCFPTFFLILAILAWLPPRIENVMIVIGLTSWTGIARYTRGEFIKLRAQDYASAARVLGASPTRIVFKHLLPNSLAPVLVSVTFGIAVAILVEAGLSWLGFGVQPPQPSWGNILRSGYDNLFTTLERDYSMIPPPCVAIFVAVLAFNLVGDAFRDVIDPRTQTAEGAAKAPSKG